MTSWICCGFVKDSAYDNQQVESRAGVTYRHLLRESILVVLYCVLVQPELYNNLKQQKQYSPYAEALNALLWILILDFTKSWWFYFHRKKLLCSRPRSLILLRDDKCPLGSKQNFQGPRKVGTQANISFKGAAPGQVFSDGDKTIRDPPLQPQWLCSGIWNFLDAMAATITIDKSQKIRKRCVQYTR